MSVKYYSTQRPIAPGSFPKPPVNKVAEIHNFDCKTYCREIGREAWGYIEYEHPLDPQDTADYELIADGIGCIGCVHENADRNMDCCWDCNRNPHRKKQDLYRHRRQGVCRV